MSLLPGNSSEGISVTIPAGDSDMDALSTGTASMTLTRAAWDPSSGTSSSNPRRQINAATGWLDGSGVYGHTADRAQMLRAFSGGLMMDDPLIGLPPTALARGANGASGCAAAAMSAPAGVDPCSLRLAGDPRANAHPGLLALHGLFVLNHNWWARRLAANASHHGWSDETLFQEARKRNIAEIQAITYVEFLPVLLGRSFAAYTGYNSSVDGRVDSVFAAAAFRYFDSGLTSVVPCLESDGSACAGGPMILRDVAHRPSTYLSYAGLPGILRGLAATPESAIDTCMVPDVRSYADGHSGDMASADIFRGRDLGLPAWTGFKTELGQKPPANFSELVPWDPALAAQLASLYSNDVRKLDLWVGGLVESAAPTATSTFGTAFRTLVRTQFTRTRSADRFYYANPDLRDMTGSGPYLPDDDMAAVSTATLAGIVKRVTDWTTPPDALFKTITAADIATLATGGAGTGTGTGGTGSGTGSGTGTGGTGTTVATTRKVTISTSPAISVEWVPPANTASPSTITLTFSFKGTGYFSFGIGASMINTDCWLMRVVGGRGEVLDTQCSGYSVPPSDAQQDLTLVSSTVSAGTSTYVVKRALVTGDTFDKSFTTGDMTVTVAWHTSNTAYSYHEGYKIGRIDFLTPLPTVNANGTNGTVTADSTGDDGAGGFGTVDVTAAARAAKIAAYGFHGLTMGFVWAVLVPACVVAVRFFKHVPAAYAFHKWGTVTALTLTLPAAGTALVQVSTGDGYMHAQLGLASSTVLVLEVMAGAITRNYLRGDKQPPPYWGYIRHGHRALGWAMTLASAANCALGVKVLFGDLAAYVSLGYFCVLTAMFGFANVILEKRREAVSQPSVKKLDEDNSRRFAMSHSSTSMTIGEVRENVRAGCRWVIVGNYIYDVGPFIKNHPGGAYLLERNLGQDVSANFFGREAFDGSVPAHAHSQLALTLLRKMCVAALKQSDNVVSWADSPPMPEQDCTEEWTLVSRIVLPGEASRPVVKLEFAHVAAEPVPALNWAPSSFGRAMVVKVPASAVHDVTDHDPNAPAKHTGALAVLGRLLRGNSSPRRRHSVSYGGQGYGSPSSSRGRGAGRYPSSETYDHPPSPGAGGGGVAGGHPGMAADGRMTGGHLSNGHIIHADDYGHFHRHGALEPWPPVPSSPRSASAPASRFEGRSSRVQPEPLHTPGASGKHHGLPPPTLDVIPGHLTGQAMPAEAMLTPYELSRRRHQRQHGLGSPDSPWGVAGLEPIYGRPHAAPATTSPGSGPAFAHPLHAPQGGRRASFGPAISNAEFSHDPLDLDAPTTIEQVVQARREAMEAEWQARSMLWEPGPYGHPKLSGRAREPPLYDEQRSSDGHGWWSGTLDRMVHYNHKDRGNKDPYDYQDPEEPLVERPYTIVRGDNRPGCIMYIRRYPFGAMSRYLYSLRPGQRLTMAGPRGLGLHLDNDQGGVIVAIYQGTGIVGAFDMLQYINANAEARAQRRRAAGKAAHKGKTWTRAQYQAAQALQQDQGLLDDNGHQPPSAAKSTAGQAVASASPPRPGQPTANTPGTGSTRQLGKLRSKGRVLEVGTVTTTVVDSAKLGSSDTAGSSTRASGDEDSPASPTEAQASQILRDLGLQPIVGRGQQGGQASSPVRPPAAPSLPNATTPASGLRNRAVDGQPRTPMPASPSSPGVDAGDDHAVPRDGGQQEADADADAGDDEEDDEDDAAEDQDQEHQGGVAVIPIDGPVATPVPGHTAHRHRHVSANTNAGTVPGRVPGTANGSSNPRRPHIQLILLGVFEHEDAIIEREWLAHMDATCPDFELHINLSRLNNPDGAASLGLPRLTTGRLTPHRLEQVLPPANLLTVSLCGTPNFVRDVRELYVSLGLPRSLLSVVG